MTFDSLKLLFNENSQILYEIIIFTSTGLHYYQTFWSKALKICIVF